MTPLSIYPTKEFTKHDLTYEEPVDIQHYIEERRGSGCADVQLDR